MVTQEEAELQLSKMLKRANVQEQPVYQPYQIQRILNITSPTFSKLCGNFGLNENQIGLRCFHVGKHKRVTHEAVVEMLVNIL